MHVHASFRDLLTVAAYMVIIGTVFRIVEFKFHDRPVGRALSVVY